SQETQRPAQEQLRRHRALLSPALFAAVTPPADLEAAVLIADRALTGEIPAQPKTRRPPVPATSLVESLTERELEVLQLMGQGLTNREIADRLVLAVGTVKYYTAEIYGKLGVRNRVQAVARARELALL